MKRVGLKFILTKPRVPKRTIPKKVEESGKNSRMVGWSVAMLNIRQSVLNKKLILEQGRFSSLKFKL